MSCIRKICCDLNLGESLCIAKFFLLSNSGLNLSNGFDFYFDLSDFKSHDTENQRYLRHHFLNSDLFQVRLAEDLGIDKTRASLLLTFVTVGSGFGRVIFGRISDIQRFNRVYIAQIAFLIVGLSNFVVPLTESYTILAIDAFIFGLFGGCYLIINPVIVCDILGSQKVSYGLGMTFFVIAIPRTLGPLIAGWIYDGLQSYAIAFYCLGVTTCISAVLASFVPILLRKQGDYIINP